MKSLVAVALIVGSVSGLGQAAPAKRPMTFADLQKMKRVSDPQVSPGGKWVMFSVTEVSLEKNTKVNHLWVVPLEGGGTTTAGPSAAPQDDNSKNEKDDQQTGAERQLTFGEVSQTFGRFSPDGKWVSLISAGGGSSQIWTAAWDEATGTMQKPHPLTNILTEADGAVWSPDSKRLLFVSSVYPECSVKGSVAVDPTHRGEAAMNGAPGFVGREAASWAEEEACDKAKDDAAAQSPVKGQVWDGLLYRHWDHYTGEKRSHMLVVSRENGEEIRDLTPASVVGDAETPTFFVGGVQNYAWAPDSKEIAYVTNLDKVPAASTNNDVFTLRLDEPGAKAVKISTSPGSDDGPAYSPDEKWIAFRSQARGGFESDRFRLMVFDRLAGTTKELMPKFDGWVDEFVWDPDSSGISFVSGEHGEAPMFLVGIGQAEGKIIKYDLRGKFSDLRSTSDGSLIAIAMSVDHPATIVGVSLLGSFQAVAPKRTDIDTQVIVPIEFSVDPNNATLDSLSLAPLEPYSFDGAEGTTVEGFIVKPPNFDPAKKYPLKFLMHGGPQTAWGDSWSYRWNWELMAADGYVVVGINRRGSTGYGQKFVDEVSGDWGGRAYEDLMKGLDYAEQHYAFIDKDRECALGASYGGYMADWVLTHTNRFKCIVTHDGMYDPVSAYGDTEELWFNEWEFRRPEDFPKVGSGEPMSQNRDMGHPAQPWRYASLPAEQDPFRKWSPALHIQDAKTPTLVIHSQRDYRLDVSQGFALFTALQRLGVPSRFLYFPDEGHWVLKPQNSQLWYETVGDWCDRWTKSGKYAAKE